MDPIFKKMQYKGQPAILALHAPAQFLPHLEAMAEFAGIHREIEQGLAYPFFLAFFTEASALERELAGVAEMLEEEALLWVAYPKKSSKRYKSDINRDSEVWKVLGQQGYEPVRQVAIDEDWSALRFRNADRIKTMKRDPSRAISKKGKKRTE